MPVKSLYERLGGMSFFEALTEKFYARVATDEALRPLYPEDLDGSRQRLCLFLAQFWGGPARTRSGMAVPACAPGTKGSASAPASTMPGWRT